MENIPSKQTTMQSSIEVKEDDLKKLIEPILKEKFEEHFIRGLKAGWNTAHEEIYNQIKDMTSAKAIKNFIKEKISTMEKENK